MKLLDSPVEGAALRISQDCFSWRVRREAFVQQA